MEITPIGFVVSEFENPKDFIPTCEKGLATETISKIKINSEFSKCLKGLEEFSHIFVLYFLNKVDKVEKITYPGSN